MFQLGFKFVGLQLHPDHALTKPIFHISYIKCHRKLGLMVNLKTFLFGWPIFKSKVLTTGDFLMASSLAVLTQSHPTQASKEEAVFYSNNSLTNSYAGYPVATTSLNLSRKLLYNPSLEKPRRPLRPSARLQIFQEIPWSLWHSLLSNFCLLPLCRGSSPCVPWWTTSSWEHGTYHKRRLQGIPWAGKRLSWWICQEEEILYLPAITTWSRQPCSLDIFFFLMGMDC